MGIVDDVLIEFETEDNHELIIEKNVREDIHLHYGNVRVEFSPSEFEEFKQAVTVAHAELVEYKNDL